MEFAVSFTTPGTYTVWARGYAENASADSLYVSLDDQIVNVTGFAPQRWDWGNKSANQQISEPAGAGSPATLSVATGGVYTLTVWMREDGLRLGRLLLTTDTTYLPAGPGPAEPARQIGTASTVSRRPNKKALGVSGLARGWQT